MWLFLGETKYFLVASCDHDNPKTYRSLCELNTLCSSLNSMSLAMISFECHSSISLWPFGHSQTNSYAYAQTWGHRIFFQRLFFHSSLSPSSHTNGLIKTANIFKEYICERVNCVGTYTYDSILKWICLFRLSACKTQKISETGFHRNCVSIVHINKYYFGCIWIWGRRHGGSGIFHNVINLKTYRKYTKLMTISVEISSIFNWKDHLILFIDAYSEKILNKILASFFFSPLSA